MLAHKERSVLLDNALTSLSEAEKTVLTMHYIHEHSLRQMAALLKVSTTTVKNRLRSVSIAPIGSIPPRPMSDRVKSSLFSNAPV